MSAAIDVRGLKRVCSECGNRFYDFNKRPIVCPSCETEFTGEMKIKSSRGKNLEEQVKAVKAKEEVEEEDAVVEDIVSLDDVDEGAKDEPEDDEAAELESIDDEELGDLGKDLDDLGGVDAGIDLDEDEDDLDADLSDVKKNVPTDD